MNKKKKSKKKKVSTNIKKATESPEIELDDIDEVEEGIGRVMKILNIVNEENMRVNDDNLRKYFDYLNEHFDFSEWVTGEEGFRWEEYYIIGPGDKKEYEKLKKKYPSYNDQYQILRLEEFDYDESISVKVKRISDKKKFDLLLVELKAVDQALKNFQLLEDFSMWFWNYR